MNKYLKYNIKYNKNDKIYYLWKNLFIKNIPVAFKSIFHGNRLECNKYVYENKIKLNENIKLPS